MMGWLGRRWRRRGQTPPLMFTFVDGATFAAAMAIVRFVWIERTRRF